MAAPTRLRACVNVLQKYCVQSQSLKHGRSVKFQNVCVQSIRFQSNHQGHGQSANKRRLRISSASLFTIGSAVLGFEGWKVYAATKEKPDIKASKTIKSTSDKSGLKLTLFQYQTCPFCCKVRAYLDYHGFSYDIVEVNSVTRKQVKWTDYRKVPILVVDGVGENGFLELRDSCVIVSLLQSYLEDQSQSLDKLHSFYPCLESKEGRKTIYDFPNKYFIMYQDKNLSSTPDERKDERKWRAWADQTMVHMLSPNVYRTPSEALQAFRYFSVVGEWEKNFSTMERMTVIYVGSAVMYVIGKLLKKRHRLNDDVRESLYESCNEWTKALGKKKKFMGGDSPNLADLAVYGVLSSIEGCDAFQDMLLNTKIGPWYQRTKVAVTSRDGASLLAKK